MIDVVQIKLDHRVPAFFPHVMVRQMENTIAQIQLVVTRAGGHLLVDRRHL